MNVPVLIIWRLHKYKKYKVEHSENEIYVLLYTELFFFNLYSESDNRNPLTNKITLLHSIWI